MYDTPAFGGPQPDVWAWTPQPALMGRLGPRAQKSITYARRKAGAVTDRQVPRWQLRASPG